MKNDSLKPYSEKDRKLTMSFMDSPNHIGMSFMMTLIIKWHFRQVITIVMISQLTNIKKVEKAAIWQHNNKIPRQRDKDSSSKNKLSTIIIVFTVNMPWYLIFDIWLELWLLFPWLSSLKFYPILNAYSKYIKPASQNVNWHNANLHNADSHNLVL